MQAPVLVLNATFEPINVTAVRRALILMLKGVAQAEETSHTEVHSRNRAGPFRGRIFCCGTGTLASFAAHRFLHPS
jgi:hypothetical protein